MDEYRQELFGRRAGMETGSIKSGILHLLPGFAQRFLKRLYYPYMIKVTTERDWPYALVARHLVTPGDCIVDAGANVGYTSALMVRWVGDEGAVYSFEPVPETFGLLSHNMSRLGYANVHPYHCALSSADGLALMEIPKYSGGGENFYQSRIVKEKKTGDIRSVSVPKKRLDSVLHDKINKISFIKIDVEGHELDVILGAERLIEFSRPAMLIEIAENPDIPGSAAHRIFSLLQSYGYTAFLQWDGRLYLRQAGDAGLDYFFLSDHHLVLLSRRGLIIGEAA